jgi:hypothetical protein
LTARKLVAINAVPIPPSLAPIGVIGMPELAMDQSKIDPSYREAIHAVWESVLPEPGWTLEFVLDDAGPALVRRSAEATLLVVGTHEQRSAGLGFGQPLLPKPRAMPDRDRAR